MTFITKSFMFIIEVYIIVFFFLYNKLYSNNTKMYNVHLTKNDISNNDVNNGVVKDYRPAI